MRDAYLIDCVRTPRGRMSRPKKNFVGEFQNVHPALLGSVLVDALLDRNPNVPPEEVEDVVYSVVVQMWEQGANLGRTVVQASKLPPTSSGLTLNRACSGAMQANAYVSASIRVGDYDIAMAGGGDDVRKVQPDPGGNQRLLRAEPEAGSCRHGGGKVQKRDRARPLCRPGWK